MTTPRLAPGEAGRHQLPRPHRAGPQRRTLERTLAAAQEQGRPIPCRQGDGADWLTEDRQTQRQAAAACRTCPAVAECAEYALTAREAAGVFGATTPAQRRRATTTSKERAA
ncbi:WhiB family transcriptional regulator [Kocuria rosea]|uniref:WhiB family transcriptional regulator n=1 Tax=Kocuria rosea TaxID=1275 RepID=UPI000D65A93A|nr:hypothetical protein DEJ37_06255 [Kocuria rosea]STX02472.1 Transcription factor WhiB [Kocuria rosea]